MQQLFLFFSNLVGCCLTGNLVCLFPAFVFVLNVNDNKTKQKEKQPGIPRIENQQWFLSFVAHIINSKKKQYILSLFPFFLYVLCEKRKKKRKQKKNKQTKQKTRKQKRKLKKNQWKKASFSEFSWINVYNVVVWWLYPKNKRKINNNSNVGCNINKKGL